MFLLALRNLRARLGRTVFTASAIALGVALVFATRMVSVAAEAQAAAIRASKLAGADLEVSPGRARFFPISIADEILKNPAIEEVAPIYRYALTESNLELLGVDPARILTPYELIVGEDLRGLKDPEGLVIWLPDIFAAQNGLGVGQTVRLTIAGQPYE
ncbi:MAG TPA: ABC transporter permease, partial [Anaerolineales bacterium]|nr:ABC transporter permease [Anaerolineales bacterium]